MANEKVKPLLDDLRREREATLDVAAGLSREELRYATGHERWSSARRVALQLGNHLREHALQIRLARKGLQRTHSEPQDMLALGEQAWGDVLAACVGLTDDDLDRVPAPGQWSVRQVIEHMIKTEIGYRKMIQKSQTDKTLAAGE
jgi:hypothetical protein